jgi:ABC-2 type transport system ATP-binding protein
MTTDERQFSTAAHAESGRADGDPVEPAIATRGLTRRFPSGIALDALDLEVFPGEVLALLGPNGAGKTTTIRLLNGVLTPSDGSATVLGLDPRTDGHELRRRTGVLTENAGLDDRLTARENLESTARIRGFDRASARARTDELLERFSMTDRADIAVQGASTGQRKRLALVRSLLHDPEVLFLDEPTSGLDPAATRDVISLIGSLASDHGRTIILCTHFLGEAGRLADRMAVLNRGRLRVSGRPAEIASTMWKGLPVELDLGGPATDRTRGVLSDVEGVVEVGPHPTGARVVVSGREVLPAVVARLVDADVRVYASTPRPPSLEDIYFAIEEQIAAEEGRPVGTAP